jgi:hypothetical protein
MSHRRTDMPTTVITTPLGVRVDTRSGWFIYDAPCTRNRHHGLTRFARPRADAKALYERREMRFSCIYCCDVRPPSEREQRQLELLFGSRRADPAMIADTPAST